MRWIAAIYASLRTLALVALPGSITQAQDPADADDRAWFNAKQLGTVAACQQYLEQFPIGRHVEEAYRCVIEEQLDSELGDPAVRGVDVY